MRTMQYVSPEEKAQIIEESITCCYRVVAKRHNVTIGTLKRIIRTHARQNERKEGMRGI
jgi:transposase-like protein